MVFVEGNARQGELVNTVPVWPWSSLISLKRKAAGRLALYFFEAIRSDNCFEFHDEYYACP